MSLFLLSREFFQIGLFAVGGGLATLPFLDKLVDKYEWFTAADLANIVAVSESTPGPLGINMATYTGFTGSGFFGGIIASLSIVLPSWIIILLVAKVLKKFNENRYVGAAFEGLRATVVGLIAAAVLGIMKLSFISSGAIGFWNQINYKALILFAALLFVRFKFQKIHPIALIGAGALLGVVCGGF